MLTPPQKRPVLVPYTPSPSTPQHTEPLVPYSLSSEVSTASPQNGVASSSQGPHRAIRFPAPSQQQQNVRRYNSLLVSPAGDGNCLFRF
jgi:hypothetical protein